jgi:glycosyltransferase involved in cell wall biosynthesis
LTAAVFAVPGPLDSPTGGYAYARRLLAETAGAGLRLEHLALPDGFPRPTQEVLEETARRLAAAPPGRSLLIDGLALGVLPPGMLRALPGPVVGLCHHPLALETGLAPDLADRICRSERAALAACAHVVTTSAVTAATLTAEYCVAPGRLTVAPPGTDPARRATGSGGPGVAILAVGSLTPRKGHDVLVEALAGLASLDWRLTIVGPADRDPAHAAALSGQIAHHGLSARIHLAGALPSQALAAVYSGADLFVLASRHEGFGMVYAEAMAHGLPVVGCDAGAVVEATRGGACLVPPDDPPALRAALARLIAEPGERARLAEACWRAAQHLPRWADTARIVADVLRGVAP